MSFHLVRTAALALLLSACSHGDAPARSEAGAPPPPKSIRLVDAGPLPDARVTCGDTVCPDPMNADVLGEIACCLPSGGCGVRSPLLGNRCLERAQRGSIDGRCPSFVTPSGARAQGCCTPAGRCGFFDRLGELGCILADTSDAAALCDYDPGSMCRAVVGIACDGPEDCAPGNACCARLNVGLYDAFACFPSCATAESTRRGVWVEACHTTSDCRSPYEVCGTAPGLPPHLARCVAREPVRTVATDASRDAEGAHEAGRPREADSGGGPGAGTGGPRDAGVGSVASADAGLGIRCGDGVCPIGGACCSRIPGEPYCTPPDQPCACAGPRAPDARDAQDER